MMTGFFFNLSAALVFICLIFAFCLDNYHRIDINRQVLTAMILGFMASMCAVIHIATNNFIIAAPAGFFTSLCLAVTAYYIYSICAYRINNKVLTLVVIIPFVLSVIIGFMFVFTKYEVLRRIGIVTDFALALGGMGFLILYRKNTPVERLFILILSYALVSGTYALVLISPEYDFGRFAIALLMAQLFIGLNNPDELYDLDTGLINIEGFRDTMRRRLYYLERNSGQKMYIVVLALHGVDSFIKLLGTANEKKLSSEVVDELADFSDIASIYRIERGLYVYLINKGDKEDAEQLKTSLGNRFKETFGQGDYEMMIPHTLCLIEMPEMAESLPNVMDAIGMIRAEGEKKNLEVISFKDLDFEREKEIRRIDEIVREAVSEGVLEVYYQPIYSVKEKKYVSAEALIRLHDGDGFIPPDKFIPIAESNGYIVEIDDFVIQQVCKMIAGRKIEELGIRYVELNLSAPDMIQDDLPEKLQRFTTMYHIHPSQLNLEITETSADSFTGIVEENVIKLSHMGFNFSLDDFGTGYSSLSRIIKLPFDIIKLDKTLVQPPYTLEDAEDRNRAMNVLESSADMLKSIGAEMVAEGVETKEQLDKLESIGVDFIQGYYFSRPLPEAEFINVLKEMNRKEL